MISVNKCELDIRCWQENPMNYYLKCYYIIIVVYLCFCSPWILCFAEMGDKTEKKRLAKWYFGGLGSAGAACCTHPLDLLKVHLQTQQGGNIGVFSQTSHIIKYDFTKGLTKGVEFFQPTSIFVKATKLFP